MSETARAFGPFVLDAADRRLLRHGQPVEVSARYFDALALLVSEAGRLVSKEQLVDRAEVVIVGVPHSAYKSLTIPAGKDVLDVWGVLSK